MKEQLIKIMKYAGYDFIEEKPLGRYLFWDTLEEMEVELWITNELEDTTIEHAIKLIINRSENRAYYKGRHDAQKEMKRSLGLE